MKYPIINDNINDIIIVITEIVKLITLSPFNYMFDGNKKALL